MTLADRETISRLYFDEPTQVQFWTEDGSGYDVGIALESYVICMECGALVDMDDITKLVYQPQCWDSWESYIIEHYRHEHD